MSVNPFSPFIDRNSRFLYPDIYLNSWNPYTLIDLQPEKDTPFKRSLPVYDVTGSTPSGIKPLRAGLL